MDLQLGEQNTIRILQAWRHHLIEEGGFRAVDLSDEGIINADTYQKYCDEEYEPNASVVLRNNNCFNNHFENKPSTAFQNVTSVETLAREFRKGLKLDKAHYKIIKNKQYFNQWKRITISTSHSHKFENVLDSRYTPRSK